ncbi:MAG: hypothetical protein Q7U78_04680 [Gallionella sp.]|nr:hypothetical protein [Gallionella sp.]
MPKCLYVFRLLGLAVHQQRFSPTQNLASSTFGTDAGFVRASLASNSETHNADSALHFSRLATRIDALDLGDPIFPIFVPVWPV